MTIHSLLNNQNILLFGLGRQGGGAGDLAYLTRHGYRVRVSDQQTAKELGIDESTLPKNAEYHLGQQTQADIDWADLIILNPGVSDSHPLILSAREAGKLCVTSIALFVAYANLPCIGITGTRGKTTTTTLLYSILNEMYPDQIILGGNIPGTSGLSLFDQSQGKRFAVLELSSFQLHSFHALKISPRYAIITNLYPDHLNRYASLAEYQSDKEAIARYMAPDHLVVYNAENSGAVAIASTSPAKRLPYKAELAASYSTQLPGLHNQSNIAGAVTLARELGCREKEISRAVAQFAVVPYRLQTVAQIAGVNYVNDTTATTPVATLTALAAQTQPVILICGGESKKLPQEQLIKEITKNKHVKNIIFLGSRHIPEFTEALSASVPNKILGQVDSMTEAVRLAHSVANSGDTVLLSPAFASFDLFKNEFDRGEQFNLAVAALNPS